SQLLGGAPNQRAASIASMMECHLAQREFKTIFLIFPEIVCARWHSIIDAIEAARWFGASIHIGGSSQLLGGAPNQRAASIASMMECHLAQREFKTIFLIFPEIVCARWHSIIDAIEAARWFGAPPNNCELPPMWIDAPNQRAASIASMMECHLAQTISGKIKKMVLNSRCARWHSIIDAIEAARWFGAPPNNCE
ncbi:MAG: hypothetical protein AAFR65_16635, partial [Pseudomonadota bacterium]